MNKQEITDILSDNSKNDWLFKKADETRRKYVGDEVHLRALIEFSNICKRQCLYCGLRSPNKEIERYRLSKDEILDSVKKAIKLGYQTIVLQSGEDDNYYQDKMCDIIKEIKKHDVALTLSLGEKTFDEYKAYKDCGADRFLLRIETTDKKLYQQMHPNASFENRVQCLENLKTLGFEVGTGCLVGLANQTIESLANDILFFKEIDADMIGIGPFIPHNQTPLKDMKQGDFWLALKVMALTRINLLNINIPATTAMETIYPQGRLIALQSGANVVMPNVSEIENRKKYEIYPDKAGVYDDEIEFKKKLEKDLISIGRTISTHKGFRKK
ncbi:MAG: [Candidatus Gastranaerophilales bacterium]|nr:[FeFe] hydrogenase H-cluster radical SAM maturase HydE [Candidatus Gastranaerophilales bacterium]